MSSAAIIIVLFVSIESWTIRRFLGDDDGDGAVTVGDLLARRVGVETAVGVSDGTGEGRP